MNALSTFLTRSAPIFALVIVATLLTSCGGDDASEQAWNGTRTVSGRVYLGHDTADSVDPYGGDIASPPEGTECWGVGDYLGIGDRAGTQKTVVEIVSDDGTVVASGPLDKGAIQSITDSEAVEGNPPTAARGCVFRFAIDGVAGDKGPLRARIPGQERTVKVSSANAAQVHLDFP